MPSIAPAVQQQLAERRGTDAHVLLWITAKNRDTGAPETIGFWTGDDHQEFLIGGEIRSYFGAGDVIDAPPIIASKGFQVRNYRISLPPLVNEVKTLIRQFEPRLAKVEIHSCPLDIDSGNALAEPLRMFKGLLNEAPEELGRKGGQSRTELVLVTSARSLTLALPLKRSNAELQRRSPSDLGREYSDIVGEWVVPWG
ncbi:hypothetical protein [Parasedimentitalea psychrophila]|uniref:Uncharacterized protein n=1 Tax=Parasedimentitalea psychrophila TaxID=2997337 RepID=A0A9Y2P6J5_9RHOB|nr:hypothetical protein [Parasedimentitalea psychrophila]WIY25068.1 hypothetical protein QPJ95_21685 [Parasedimentitalea psychrophila]